MSESTSLRESLRQLKPVLYYAAAFSIFINLLLLTIPIYMLQVFDRVIPGQSADTLIYLTAIAIAALSLFALLDAVRNRMMWMSGRWLEREWVMRLLPKAVKDAPGAHRYSEQCLHDVNFLRQYISTGSLNALFDSALLPLFLFVVFMIKPILGVIVLLAALMLFCIAWLHERFSRRSMQQAGKAFATASFFMKDVLQQREVFSAMECGQVATEKLLHYFSAAGQLQDKSLQRADVLQSAARYIRLVTQLLILGLGAYFVITNRLTAGGMIAASIIGARALQPFEQMIKAWRQSFSAIDAFKRLERFVVAPVASHETSSAPSCVVKIDNAYYLSENDRSPLLQAINLKIEVGEMVAVVGPSGSGKTSLVRLIAGVLKATQGYVQLSSKRVGYLSQDSDVFSGTIAENIAGLMPIDLEKIQMAAQLVGADRFIKALRHGFDTSIDEIDLSRGQKQLICLARAFCQLPALIILDEPEAYLDQLGDAGLRRALHVAKRAHSSVVLVTQRPSLVEMVDRMVVMQDGVIQQCGPVATVLPHLRGSHKDTEKNKEQTNDE